MQIVQINEPGSSNNDEQTGVGIDFGTTNSLIAFSNGQLPKIIIDEHSLELVPSIISSVGNEFIIGNNTNNAMEIIRSIKRLFGKRLSDVRNNPALFALVKDYVDLDSEILRIKFAGKLLTIAELASQIFLYLKEQAIRELGEEVKKAVITVPAHFNDAARGEVILAAKIAGFDVLRLIAEPTAAAYAYGLNKNNVGYYLIYDLGGGTFDVSILNMQTGVLQVIATGGDNLLGGDDIDHLIMEHFCTKYKLLESKELNRFAKKAKENLTNKDKFKEQYQNGLLELNIEEFEQLISPLINRTLDITKDTLEQAGNPNISGIILVGGTTRVPLIRKTLQHAFNTTIYSDIDPDKAVVWGAALQAENLTSVNINSLLIDVVPLSLSLELDGGITEKIILRNTPIPISVTKEFTTSVDNQHFMKLHVLQGEREMVEDCRSLAEFELKLPLMKAGAVKAEVTFSIDVDGILSVSALEKNSGVSHIVLVKPTYGLSQDEIAKILEDSYQHVQEDHDKKLLQEAIIYSKSLIYNVEKAVKEIGNLLEKKEIENVNNAVKILQEAIKSDSRDYIMDSIKNFEMCTEDLISKRLNNAVTDLLKGQNIKKY
ncbi:MAG: Fe-S protein assembly chaperone HscA [Rickettsia endosymbiont of Bryobia graminum]|nr:Fe-S protein assembly chaperone HscA [Rickettsia endosymbiont of Bryobia graminum]